MLPNDVHYAFLSAERDGVKHHHPAGRFLVLNGELHHLEDYHGLLEREIPEGAIDDVTLTKLSHPGSGLQHASRSALLGGFRDDLLPEADLQPLPQDPPQLAQGQAPVEEARPPSVWHYTRAGHDQPHVLEARAGKYLLDGNPLEPHEVETILANVRTKAARLRYPKASTGVAIAKAEAFFESLQKGYEDEFADEYDQLPPQAESGSGSPEMDPQEALAHLSDAAGKDPKSAAALKALRRHIFEDQMVPGLGNKFAYGRFREEGRPGTTVVGDANFFKQINDQYGHEAGDAAIKALGSAWRDAARDVGEGKAHRFGGDEFHVQFPTYGHAARFARELRSRLETIPPVGGTHRLSMSIGIGHDFPSADQAVYQAKATKGLHTPSTVPHLLAHSLHQESPGPVPVEGPRIPLVAPTPEQRAPAEQPSAAPSRPGSV